MADTIDPFVLWTSFNGLVNSFQGGFYPPITVFMPAVNAISNEMWQEKTPQAENDQKIEEDLMPFLRTKNCTVNANNSMYGTFNNPVDYGYYSASRLIVHEGKTCGEKGQTCSQLPSDEQTEYEEAERYRDGVEEVNVMKISSSKWAACLSSITKAPTLQKPKITQISVLDNNKQTTSGFKVAPRKISVIVLDYYVMPTDAVFAYTTAPGNVQTGSGDQIIYNKSQSTPLQWNPTLINEFLWRLAERFGITTRDQFMTQYAGAKTK